jgi:hypothetical protein
MVDLDPLDEGPDEVPPRVPISGIQAILDPIGEALQLLQDGPEFLLEVRGVSQLLLACLQGRQALLLAFDAGLELDLVQETLGVAIDQPRNRAAHLGHFSLQMGLGILLVLRGALKASPIFGLQPLGVSHDVLDGRPHRLVQLVRSDLLGLADPGSLESVGIRADAAVVGVVPLFALAGFDAYWLPVKGIPTLLALHQSLQEICRTASTDPRLFSILLQLLLGGLEQFRRHDRGDWHQMPFLGRDIVDGMSPSRLLGMSTSRVQPLAHGAQARLSKGSRALVGRVPEHGPHLGPVPCSLPLGRGNALGREPPTSLADRAPVPTDPFKDTLHDLGLFGDQLHLSPAPAFILGEISVAIGRTRKHVHGARLGRMQLASPAALHDLLSLVLRHHALDLKQQVILRRLAQGAVQEHDLNARPHQLLDENNLVGVVAHQTVGRMHVEPVQGTSGGHVPKAFQGGPDQGRAAEPVVHEPELVLECVSVRGDTFLESRDLALDRASRGLLFGGNPCVDCHLAAHWLLPLP